MTKVQHFKTYTVRALSAPAESSCSIGLGAHWTLSVCDSVRVHTTDVDRNCSATQLPRQVQGSARTAAHNTSNRLWAQKRTVHETESFRRYYEDVF